jgi:hypothetical protein
MRIRECGRLQFVDVVVPKVGREHTQGELDRKLPPAHLPFALA